MKSIYYLDSNAVTKLWDLWTGYSSEGSTGDDISKTPFNRTIVSSYSLDECLNISHTSNAYKKHLCMFSIYPQIQVLKPITIFDDKKIIHDQSSIDDLLEDKGFLSGVVSMRAQALISEGGQKNLAVDIENKNEGKKASTDESANEPTVAQDDKIDADETLEMLIKKFSLSPVSSKHDFYQLCMYLYVARRKGVVSGLGKKGRSRNLNQKIDSYHLSYLPYVDGLISGDKDLIEVAKHLSKYLDHKIELLEPKKFWETWLRQHLAG